MHGLLYWKDIWTLKTVHERQRFFLRNFLLYFSLSGVTVGVVLVIGAILFTAFAFLLWRRRQNTHHKQTRNTREINQPTTAEGSGNEGTGYQYEVNIMVKPGQLSGLLVFLALFAYSFGFNRIQFTQLFRWQHDNIFIAECTCKYLLVFRYYCCWHVSVVILFIIRIHYYYRSWLTHCVIYHQRRVRMLSMLQ